MSTSLLSRGANILNMSLWTCLFPRNSPPLQVVYDPLAAYRDGTAPASDNSLERERQEVAERVQENVGSLCGCSHSYSQTDRLPVAAGFSGGVRLGQQSYSWVPLAPLLQAACTVSLTLFLSLSSSLTLRI